MISGGASLIMAKPHSREVGEALPACPTSGSVESRVLVLAALAGWHFPQNWMLQRGCCFVRAHRKPSARPHDFSPIPELSTILNFGSPLDPFANEFADAELVY